MLQKKLSEIVHYKNYPAMTAFVGEDFQSTEHKKLLLVGESNYLPRNSNIHLNAKKWYDGNQSNLTAKEIQWIHCVGLLECDWNNGGHRIYKELNRCLNETFGKNYEKATNHIAYLNAFQRPAIEGDSIKNIIEPIDAEKSYDVLNQVSEIIHPDLVIFVSKYSWDNFGEKLRYNFPNLQIDFVCHPGTGGKYWHNRNYAHGKSKFLKVLKESYLN